MRTRLLVTSLFFWISILLFGQNFKYVNVETLNVRKDPGTEYAIKTQLHKGDKVEAFMEIQGWTEIETESGIIGYVASEYLSDHIENKKIDNSSTRNKDDYNWVFNLMAIIVIGYFIVGIIRFILDFIGYSPSAKSNSLTKRPIESKNNPQLYLYTEKGFVYLSKENSTMKKQVYYLSDKAIECDLEDSTSENSQYLVVTENGHVILRNLKSSRNQVVYKSFVSYGNAIKAHFEGKESFIFTTKKGTFRGYFKSTKIEKIH